MIDWNSLINRINRHEESYKKTGLIGVQEHVLLKELFEARDTIEQLQADKERLTNALYAGLVAFENHGLKLTANYLQMKDALAPPEERYLNAD